MKDFIIYPLAMDAIKNEKDFCVISDELDKLLSISFLKLTSNQRRLIIIYAMRLFDYVINTDDREIYSAMIHEQANILWPQKYDITLFNAEDISDEILQKFLTEEIKKIKQDFLNGKNPPRWVIKTKIGISLIVLNSNNEWEIKTGIDEKLFENEPWEKIDSISNRLTIEFCDVAEETIEVFLKNGNNSIFNNTFQNNILTTQTLEKYNDKSLEELSSYNKKSKKIKKEVVKLQFFNEFSEEKYNNKIDNEDDKKIKNLEKNIDSIKEKISKNIINISLKHVNDIFKLKQDNIVGLLSILDEIENENGRNKNTFVALSKKNKKIFSNSVSMEFYRNSVFDAYKNTIEIKTEDRSEKINFLNNLIQEKYLQENGVGTLHLKRYILDESSKLFLEENFEDEKDIFILQKKVFMICKDVREKNEDVRKLAEKIIGKLKIQQHGLKELLEELVDFLYGFFVSNPTIENLNRLWNFLSSEQYLTEHKITVCQKMIDLLKLSAHKKIITHDFYLTCSKMIVDLAIQEKADISMSHIHILFSLSDKKNKNIVVKYMLDQSQKILAVKSRLRYLKAIIDAKKNSNFFFSKQNIINLQEVFISIFNQLKVKDCSQYSRLFEDVVSLGFSDSLVNFLAVEMEIEGYIKENRKNIIALLLDVWQKNKKDNDTMSKKMTKLCIDDFSDEPCELIEIILKSPYSKNSDKTIQQYRINYLLKKLDEKKLSSQECIVYFKKIFEFMVKNNSSLYKYNEQLLQNNFIKHWSDIVEKNEDDIFVFKKIIGLYTNRVILDFIRNDHSEYIKENLKDIISHQVRLIMKDSEVHELMLKVVNLWFLIGNKEESDIIVEILISYILSDHHEKILNFLTIYFDEKSKNMSMYQYVEFGGLLADFQEKYGLLSEGISTRKLILSSIENDDEISTIKKLKQLNYLANHFFDSEIFSQVSAKEYKYKFDLLLDELRNEDKNNEVVEKSLYIKKNLEYYIESSNEIEINTIKIVNSEIPSNQLLLQIEELKKENKNIIKKLTFFYVKLCEELEASLLSVENINPDNLYQFFYCLNIIANHYPNELGDVVWKKIMEMAFKHEIFISIESIRLFKKNVLWIKKTVENIVVFYDILINKIKNGFYKNEEKFEAAVIILLSVTLEKEQRTCLLEILRQEFIKLLENKKSEEESENIIKLLSELFSKTAFLCGSKVALENQHYERLSNFFERTIVHGGMKNKRMDIVVEVLFSYLKNHPLSQEWYNKYVKFKKMYDEGEYQDCHLNITNSIDNDGLEQDAFKFKVLATQILLQACLDKIMEQCSEKEKRNNIVKNLLKKISNSMNKDEVTHACLMLSEIAHKLGSPYLACLLSEKYNLKNKTYVNKNLKKLALDFSQTLRTIVYSNENKKCVFYDVSMQILNDKEKELLENIKKTHSEKKLVEYKNAYDKLISTLIYLGGYAKLEGRRKYYKETLKGKINIDIALKNLQELYEIFSMDIKTVIEPNAYYKILSNITDLKDEQDFRLHALGAPDELRSQGIIEFVNSLVENPKVIGFSSECFEKNQITNDTIGDDSKYEQKTFKN